MALFGLYYNLHFLLRFTLLMPNAAVENSAKIALFIHFMRIFIILMMNYAFLFEINAI